MTEPAFDPVVLAELADRLAERLGPERESEITAHLARLVERQTGDPASAVEAAHTALRSAPGAPATPLGRGRGALVAAVEQLATEVAAQRVALDAILAALGDSWRVGSHHHPDLEGELDALHDRFTQADRHRAWTPTDLDVASRLSALERATGVGSPLSALERATGVGSPPAQPRGAAPSVAGEGSDPRAVVDPPDEGSS